MADQVDIVAGEPTWAARCGSGPTRPCWPRARSWRRPTAAPRSPSGTGTATRSNNAYRDRARGGRPGRSRAPRRTAGWSSSSSCPATCTRSSSAPRPTRSSSRARPGRTRCSRLRRRRARAGQRRAGRARCDHAAGRRSVGGKLSPVHDRAGRRRYPVGSLDHWPFRSGRVIDVRTDEVTMPDGSIATRDVVVHPGAVGIIALDNAGQVLLLRAVPPPGRADALGAAGRPARRAGEDPLVAAKRELYEEAHLQAERWDVLLDIYTSPGMSDEAVRIYLARDVSPSTAPRFAGQHEEADLPTQWVPLDRGGARGPARRPAQPAGGDGRAGRRGRRARGICGASSGGCAVAGGVRLHRIGPRTHPPTRPAPLGFHPEQFPPATTPAVVERCVRRVGRHSTRGQGQRVPGRDHAVRRPRARDPGPRRRDRARGRRRLVDPRRRLRRRGRQDARRPPTTSGARPT